MRIGTILHGAYGDVYEQALSISLLKAQCNSSDKFIAFFSRQDRLKAFSHFKFDMFDEIYAIDDIESVPIDSFYQYQINDIELKMDILKHLSNDVMKKFNLTINYLPWKTLKKHDFIRKPLSIVLSGHGIEHYQRLLDKHDLSSKYRHCKLSIGYLWRYRSRHGAVKPYFQKSKNWIIQSKSELFNLLIEKHNAHIVIAGMNAGENTNSQSKDQKDAGVLLGEIEAKFANDTLDIPAENVTYLSGDGYGSEMEIIANTDIQIVMPSGFSEPLWMRNGMRTLLVDPPPVYLLKLLKYRMPLFDNTDVAMFYYNNLKKHTARTVYKELRRRKLL